MVYISKVYIIMWFFIWKCGRDSFVLSRIHKIIVMFFIH
nr:MAG TPA: hypothetical protein [Caudoviricetes sp.]